MRRPVVASFFASLTLILASLSSIVSYGSSNGTANTTGRTLKTATSDAQSCGQCHTPKTGTAVTGTFTGAAQLYPGDYGNYKLTVQRTDTSSTYTLGVDIAASDTGTPLTVTGGEFTTVVNGEVTHATTTANLRRVNTTSNFYSFRYTMPATATAASTHTIYGTYAMGPSTGGGWNHATSKTVTAKAMPTAPSTLSPGSPTSSSVPLNISGGGPQYRILANTSTYAANSTDGTIAYEGSSAAATATGLNAGTNYYFSAFSKDVGPDSGLNFFSTTAATTTAATLAATDPNPWVDATNGSDLNGGTKAAPFKTIKKALTAVGPSGTIHVQPGTYNTALGETFPITVPSGIILQSTSGAASTIIDATGANTRVLFLNGNSATTTVEGFTITGGLFIQPVDGGNANGGGILAQNSDQTTITRCIITGNESRGYNGNGAGFNAGGQAYGGGIVIQSSTTKIINSVIRNNIVRGGNGASFLGVNGSGGNGGNGQGGGIWAFGAITLTNNTFYGNQAIGGNGGTATQATYGGGSAGTALYGAVDAQNGTGTNNIFANNSVTAGTPGSGPTGSGGPGGAIGGGVNLNTATYNLFFNNTNGDGSTGTNAITGQDPLFVNAPTDLHVRSASPAKLAGASGQVTVDLENSTRAFNPTIGAYEMLLSPTAWPGIGKIVVTWPVVDGASSYNLYFSTTNPVSTGSTKITGATSPYILAPLPNNQIYFIAITAIENGVEGPLSPQVNATTSNGSWVQGALPNGGGSFTNLARDVANGATLYATSTDSVGLYKSTNAGDTWLPVPGPYSGSAMRAVAANGTTVLIAGAGSIYRSTNGGTSWTAVVTGAGIGEDFIASLAIDPLAPTIAYAGDFHINGGSTSSQLVAKSTDGGATFTNLLDASANNLRAYYLAIDPAISGTLYAAGSGTPNVGKSTNNGSTWTSASPAAGYPTALALAPSSTSTLFAGMRDVSNSASTGIWRSTNSGTNWIQYNSGLPGILPDITSFSVDSRSALKVHAGTSAGDYVSVDGGLTWAVGPSGGGALYANAMVETSTRRLVATTANAIRLLPLDPAPAISTLNVTTGSVAGGTSVTVNGTGFNVATGLRVLFGGTDAAINLAGSTTTAIVVTSPAHPIGTVDVIVINPDGENATKPSAFTYSNAAGAIALNALAAPGQVGLTWTSVPGATQYQVSRSVAGSALSPLTTTGSLGYTDSAVSNGTGYLYQVTVSIGATGSSNVDLAVPMAYTRPALSAGGIIYAIDWAETRTAVNAARVAVGLGAMTFTDPSLSAVKIKRVHLIEIRAGVDEARAALGLPALSYTDSTITTGTTKVKPVHLTEPRDGVK